MLLFTALIQLCYYVQCIYVHVMYLATAANSCIVFVVVFAKLFKSIHYNLSAENNFALLEYRFINFMNSPCTITLRYI